MDERALRTLEYYKIRQMLVERAATRMGKERCEDLLPATDPLTVEHRQAETAEARLLMGTDGSIPLGGIRDIREAIWWAARGASLDPPALLDVAGTVAAARRLRKFLYDEREAAPILAAYAAQIGSFPDLEQEITHALTDDAQVADHASPELQRIRKEMRVRQNRVRERLEGMIRNPNLRLYLQDALVTIRDDRYVLPVKVEYKAQVPGVVHDTSASGSTLFIEPMAVVELNNQIRELAGAEREEIARILARLSGLVGAAASELRQAVEAIGQIDLAAAKAALGRQMGAATPGVNRDGALHIVRGRHPLLKGRVVPIDVHLGDRFDVLVITGPNTGGKTVTLKTVGLFCLLAQAGLQVPAAAGTALPVLPQVFADIGDEQSIEQSLSTFSSHMSHIVAILDEVEPGALVLLDELGAGTDPTEGAALAMALLDHLQARGVRVIATTHYAELKAFAYNRQRVENASVEFDIETLRPTYRLQIGVPGASQAFAIARRLGLNPALVERAAQLISDDQERVEVMLNRIAETSARLEQEKEAAIKARSEAQRVRQESEERLRRAKEREREILDRARAQAAELLARVQREANAVLAELKAAQREQRHAEQVQALDAARGRLKELARTTRSLRPQAEPAGPPPADLKPGETVRIVSLDATGQVLAPPDGGGQVLVQAGIMKLTVPLTDLARVEEPVGQAGALRAGSPGQAAAAAGAVGLRPERRVTVQAAASRADFGTELDLRGLTVEEALARTDKYLDDAVLAGAETVRIIHGKGTGALRKAMQDFLRAHPAVSEHRLGGLGEGGDGVTIARLSGGR